MRITETKVISLINFTEIFFVNVHINLILLIIHCGYILWIYIVDIFQERKTSLKVKIYLRVGLSVSCLRILQLLVIKLKVFHNYKIASRIIHLISDFRTREPCLNSHFWAFESKNFFICRHEL